MATRLLALIAILLALAPAAKAQDADAFPRVGSFTFLADEKVSFDPDGSYLFNHTDGALVFEAQTAPEVRIVDNVSRQLERVMRPERPRVFAFSVFGTFMVRLRMFDTTSSPVRTPSYMPKGTVQLAWLKNLSTADREDSPVAFLEGPIEMWLVSAIPFGHHSNGQDGCLFTDQARVDDECVPEEPSEPRPETVNRKDGSFSTNYIRVGVQYRRLHPRGDDPVDVRAITRREWGVGASLELNPRGYLGGSISDTLRPLYGPTRVGLSADVIAGNWRPPVLRRVTCGRAWADLSLTFIRGAASSVENVVTSAEAACLPGGWGGAGLFVRYYRGQDYYNASFLENINRLQFGVTFMHGKFLGFPAASN
ncbi:MAG: hypothetical protein IT177_18960 [Acidobacteria bacterium]|nr:hypothetical protein [Acidobacteriota bacterium]